MPSGNSATRALRGKRTCAGRFHVYLLVTHLAAKANHGSTMAVSWSAKAGTNATLASVSVSGLFTGGAAFWSRIAVEVSRKTSNVVCAVPANSCVVSNVPIVVVSDALALDPPMLVVAASAFVVLLAAPGRKPPILDVVAWAVVMLVVVVLRGATKSHLLSVPQ